MSVKITDNSDKVLELFEKAKKQALTAIGITAERFAKTDTSMPVDTGRARNSITWATAERQGEQYSYTDERGNRYAEKIGVGADKNSVYIGSNVEYFPYIELGSRNMRARHILKNASSNHGTKYKKLVENIFKNA